MSAADRTLTRVGERAEALGSVDDINGFFAADPMVARVRKLVDDLRELGEPVRADELQSRLGASKDSAARALRDKQDLFEGDAVKLGRYRFSVDDRARELTIVPSQDQLEAVLTGTDLRLPITSDRLLAHQELWTQPLASENDDLYRSTFLAGDLVATMLHRPSSELGQRVRAALADEREDAVLDVVRAEVDQRLDEGYDRGVHDVDAALILTVLGQRALAADTLIFPGAVRARAQIWWAHHMTPEQRDRWADRGRAGAVLSVDPDTRAALAVELGQELDDPTVGRYLMNELLAPDGLAFARTRAAAELTDRIAAQPDVRTLVDQMDDDLDGAIALLGDHVRREVREDEHALVDEIVAALLTPDLERRIVDLDPAVSFAGLTGRHRTVVDGSLTGRVDDLLAAVEAHRDHVLPAHRDFGAARREALDHLRNELRVEEIEPRVPEGFVRNQLIDQVYLPLIGDNLARQIGTIDDRTGARSGLLMLLSPPGYGKTLLVEYLADRLGMALVKVSGPGLGHDVTSLDPGQAPSATAAREIERINLAFATGSNVILYLDDIQHTNAEFLQRFISLCDAQRRVEGVWNGESASFDLRGKRFAVVMAGNPYTESGERFRVPDMLANRADTYNLGDVLDGNADVFARSYLENALTANPILAPLAGTDPGDLTRFFAAADGEPIDESSLVGSYSSSEVVEIVSTLTHLRQVQRVVLAVNRQYIASAATADEYRTEPPFLLQGSYRNMARMASKLLPAMTSDEVDRIIDEHYNAESQALTGAAESNLLKLAELRGTMTPEQEARWADMLGTFRRSQRLGGDERDPATRVVAAIETVADALGGESFGLGARKDPTPTEFVMPAIEIPTIEIPPVVIPPIDIPPAQVTVEVAAPEPTDNSEQADAMVAAIEKVAEALSMADPLAARAIDLLASEAANRRSSGTVPPRPSSAIPPKPPSPATGETPPRPAGPPKPPSNLRRQTKPTYPKHNAPPGAGKPPTRRPPSPPEPPER